MGNAKYKQKHREQGLCQDCSRRVVPFQNRCIIHGERVKLYTRRWLKRPGKYQDHLEKARKLKQLYRDTNRCYKCSAPLGEQDEGYKTCVNCSDSTFKAIRKGSPIAGGLLENYYKAIASKS